MPLTLEIVTPEEIVYRDSVDSVVLPTVVGEAGILPGHVPILTMLKPGELAVTKNGEKTMLAVDKGFAQVLGDKVSVLAEGAIDIAEIDMTAVEEAQERAEKALAEARAKKLDPAEVEKLETIVRFSLAQKLAKKKRY